MSSINTNRAALQALQAANSARRDLAVSEKRLSTGLKVASTADDSAVYITAQTLRSDTLLWEVAAKGLARTRSIIDVGVTGAELISDLMIQLREKGTLLADAGPNDHLPIQRDIAALVKQIDTIAKSSEFGGINLLVGKPVIETESSHSYGTGWTSISQEGFQVPMSALPPGTLVERMAQSRLVLPKSALTPATYEAVERSLHGYSPRVTPMDGGPTAGRLNLLLEQTSGADGVEIWQNGTRVAATGQAYAADGAAVEPASPVNGPRVISFDYDPAKGQNLEVRVTSSNFWQIGGLELQDPAEPVPAPIEVRAYSSRITTNAVFMPPIGTANPEQAGQALHDPPEVDGRPQDNVRIVEVPGGTEAGRVEVGFDAFESPDTMEVWQDGVRVAATGQPYTPGGAMVGAATPVSGLHVLNFDYDPARGPLTFKFNENGAAEASAWHVGTMTLHQIDSIPGIVSAGSSSQQRDSYGPYPYDFNVTPSGLTEGIRTRDLTSAGLDLDDLENGSPGYILDRIRYAEGRVTRALTYLGNKSRIFGASETYARSMVDIRQTAIGRMVDADMAKEAAILQANQVRQQLATQALSIANNSKSYILSLFK